MKNDKCSGHGVGVACFAAPAKLNLYLHVLGRREDGYYLLDSLMVFVHVGDSIVVQPAKNLSLTVEGSFAKSLDADDSNLVLRAARALAGTYGVIEGAGIRLIKNLPVASGIGGGSADAAATLRALCHLWRLKPASKDLAALALGLGADVPFCLAGQAGFVGGIGESIKPAAVLPTDVSAAWVVLINPLTTLATPAVFSARSGSFSQPGRFDNTPRNARDLATLLKERRNDLTEAAISLSPEIGNALDALESSRGSLLARMSGSGATCFGLFDGEDDARQAAAVISGEAPGWWVVTTRLASDIADVTLDEGILAGS